jgi:hypothetical protein
MAEQGSRLTLGDVGECNWLITSKLFIDLRGISEAEIVACNGSFVQLRLHGKSSLAQHNLMAQLPVMQLPSSQRCLSGFIRKVDLSITSCRTHSLHAACRYQSSHVPAKLRVPPQRGDPAYAGVTCSQLQAPGCRSHTTHMDMRNIEACDELDW